MASPRNIRASLVVGPGVALYIAGIANSIGALVVFGLGLIAGGTFWIFWDMREDWEETEEELGTDLIPLSDVLSRAYRTIYPNGKEGWEDIAKRAPWPPNLKSPIGVNLTVWERDNIAVLCDPRNGAIADAFALAKLVYNSPADKAPSAIHHEPRKRIRILMDKWDALTWWSGFSPVRRRIVKQRGYALRMMAYLEIALAPFVDPRRDDPLLWMGWLRLGERWKL